MLPQDLCKIIKCKYKPFLLALSHHIKIKINVFFLNILLILQIFFQKEVNWYEGSDFGQKIMTI
jgi:hypothetical protein